MKLWRNNRLDGEFEMEPAKIVELFAASKYADMDMFLERRLRLFMTDPEGPVAATWDEPDFGAVFERALTWQDNR